MGKENKLKMGCGILFAIGLVFFIVRIYNEFKVLDNAFKAKEYSTSIEFKGVNQTIFITTRRWGLGGQHFHAVISNVDHSREHISFNREKEIVLDDRCGLYYKKQGQDSLFIFLPSNSYTEERESYRQIGNVSIKIMEVKKMTYDSFKNNYKTLELSPIFCCDSLK